MKLFLQNILFGSIFFIIFLILFEFFVISRVPNEFSYKYNYVNENGEKIAILLMGNSYFEKGINPEYIADSIFDLAVVARWIHYDNELLNEFLPSLPNLRTIIYPMGYSQFYRDYDNIGSAPQADFFHQKYMHVWNNRFPQNIDRWLAIRYSDRIGFKQWNVAVDSTWNGYSPYVESCSIIQKKKESDVFKDITQIENSNSIVEEYTNYMISMAKTCKEYGVRFIVVTPPYHELLYQKISDLGVKMMYDVIECVSCHAPIEYKNYLFDSEFQVDSLYYDCTHLNSIGADKFAIRVKNDFNL